MKPAPPVTTATLRTVGVPIVVEAVGHEVVAEGAAKITHGVLDAALGLEAEDAVNLVRIDVIGAHVVGRRCDDLDLAFFRHLFLHHLLHHAGDLGDRIVLKSDVEDLAVDFFMGRGQHQVVGVDHVVDMQVRPHLVAAEHRDRALVDRVVGEDVDREIEAGARAVSADGGWADDDASEVVRLVLPQDRLAHAFELVVERERNERVVFGHVGRVAHAVHRARGAVHEPFHARFLGRDHERLETIVVDGL